MLSVYGILSIGVQLHLHYCCGELADVNIFSSQNCTSQESDDQNCCHMTSNCCTYENLSFKLDDSHNPTYFKLPLLPTTQDLTFEIPRHEFVSLSQNVNLSFEVHYPPTDRALFLLNHALILYA